MNGYKNIETYFTVLWLESNELFYHNLMSKAFDTDIYTFAEHLRNTLEEYVYSELDNVKSPVIHGYVSDLMNLIFDKIDFVEVARALTGEY